MKKNKFILPILLVGSLLYGCSDKESITPSRDFLIPSHAELLVGDYGYFTICGVDTCYAQLTYGDSIVEMRARYTIDDRYYYHGVTTYLLLKGTSIGEAQCRLFNPMHGLDTSFMIYVTDGSTPTPVQESEYQIIPENRQFYTDQDTVTFKVKGPKSVGMRIMDEFLLSSSVNGRNSINDNCTSWFLLNLNYVGDAKVKFYNEDFDTIINIQVLPRYNTYEEPNVDFDDTRDSVIAKLGTPATDNTTDNYLLYDCTNGIYPYSVKVNMLSSGRVKDIEVIFEDEAAKDELQSFVEERYKKYYSTWNGYYVYVRAFNVASPSSYDASTRVLVENFLQGKVIYKNPSNHSNW